MPVKRHCIICSINISNHPGQARVCSSACSNERHRLTAKRPSRHVGVTVCCEQCNQSYIAKASRQKYCSSTCYYAALCRRQKSRYVPRTRPKRHCESCGREFVAKHNGKHLYCSIGCEKAAKYFRQRSEPYRTSRRERQRTRRSRDRLIAASLTSLGIVTRPRRMSAVQRQLWATQTARAAEALGLSQRSVS